MELSQEEAQSVQPILRSGNKDPSIMGDPDIGFFTNKHGLKIKTLKWLVKAPVGIVFLVHSLNSHCRFDYLKHNVTIPNNDKAILNDGENFYVHKDSWIEELNKNGYSVYGLDLQGHGESECYKNKKTYINEFDDFADDILQYMNGVHESIVNEAAKDNQENDNNAIGQKKRCTKCDLILKDESDICCSNEDKIIANGLYLRHPEKNQYKKPDYNIDPYKTPIPMYLVGLSMGGNIVLRILELLSQRRYKYYNRLNIKGACSLSGMLSAKDVRKKPSWKYFYIPLMKLSSVFFPKSRFAPNTTYEAFPFLKDLYGYDKIFYDKPITNKFVCKLLEAADNLNKDADKVVKDVPILIVHSANDQKCSHDSAQEFYNNLKTKKKEFHTLDDMEHMITMEPGNEQVIKKLVDWMAGTQKETPKKKKVKKNLRSADDKSAASSEASPTQSTSALTDLPKDKATQDQVSQEQPAEEQATEEQPVEEQPIEEQPVEEQPIEEQPVEEQATEDQSAEEQDTQEQPTEEHDTQEQPAEEHDTQEQPTEEHDTQEHPAEEHDTQEQPTEEHDTQEHPAEEQDTQEQPAEEQDAQDQSAEEQDIQEQPAEEQDIQEQPAEEQAIQDQSVEEQAAEEQAAEEQAAQDQAAQEQPDEEQALENEAA
ncbi:lysophospholipase, putative [Plasmodium chabaudi chabaudi]|uniref:Lysophospholipase, putative n=1 Tax=Plasmodium chabaudi chabaudi TaxID=31271 RepID=A0A4V0KAQ0_PLACU|nr:lysophospholipase, putative [Plasmodium chabaudi chabaudi]VTZ69680.1 lysophospholipase, putative [Plasmodium chabaudi chabaudi]|eukprot:XP_734333.2 lysophospholipase, putative [Plasmodium chabaudi chabaudi]